MVEKKYLSLDGLKEYDSLIKEHVATEVDTIKDIKADWNQNDSTAPDFIKNRTHYAYEDELEFYEYSTDTPTFTDNIATDGTCYIAIEGVYCPSFEKDVTYKVTINGKTEETQRAKLSPLLIGNGHMRNSSIEDTGETFYAMRQNDQRLNVYFKAEEVPSSFSIKITYPGEIVHQLDEKYIDYKPGYAVKQGEVYEIVQQDGSLVDAIASGGGVTFGNSIATGSNAFAEGKDTFSLGTASHSEGISTVAEGSYSHAEGLMTFAAGRTQHVQGEYNIIDSESRYAHIIGNGSYSGNYTKGRSNAHTVDWDGNAWYAGTIKVGGTSYDDASEVALKYDIDILSEKLGTVPEGQTVMEIVNNIQENAYDDTAIVERVAQAETDIDNIQKDYLTSTDKEELQGNIDTVASAVELLTNGVNAETVDGVNDLIAYVNEHGTEVTGMKADIQANADAIDGLATVATTGSWNDLSDKPFIEEEIIYFEHTFSAADEDYNKEQLSLTVGKTYVVEVNGIEYDVVCEEEYGSGYKMIQFRTNENYGIIIYEFQQSAYDFPESVECHVILKDKDKVVNILEEYIPDTIARIEDVVDMQVQSDWNQNDESAQDFVKNRPFYEEVSETDISGTEYELPTGSGVQAHNSNIPFKLGQVWKLGYLKNAPSGMSWVYLDEMEVKEADDGTLYIGDYPNVEIVPYYVTSNEQNLTYEFTLNTTGSYGLALTCVYGVVIEETVHQLDEKFIPDSIARVSDVVDMQVQSDWNQSDETAVDYVKNRTHWAEKKIVGETRTVGYGECSADTFLETLYENRQTARYIDSNGVEFYYNSDILNNSDVCKWIVTTGDGTTIGAMYVFDIKNKIFFADVSEDNPITITVSSEIIEEVHPLDEKFIPDSIARVSDVTNLQTALDEKANTSHTHDNATTSVAGFMTPAMVSKLNGIADGATNVVVDSALSASSTNPVQNMVVNSAISTLTSAVSTNTSSISAHSTAISNLQTIVSGIQEITSDEIQALFA